MRGPLKIIVAGFIAIAPIVQATAAELDVIETGKVTIGDRIFVKLPGNPDLGYKWRLNEKRSKGLDRVQVEKIGWLMGQKEKSIFAKATSKLNVLVTGKSAGMADIAFDYYRLFGGRVISKTSIVRITVEPKADR